MNFFVVLDVSSIIWSRDDYEANAHHYYDLANHIVKFLEMLEAEKPKILLRNQLLSEMIDGFPFDQLPNDFHSFGTLVYSFFGKAAPNLSTYPPPENHNITSIPSLIKTHYNENTKTEINYLISKIHVDFEEEKVVFFTFSYLYRENTNLKTFEEDTSKEYHTVIADIGNDLEEFFAKLRPKFEHNPKHDKSPYKTRRAWEETEHKSDFISQLSCYNGTDNERPQYLLNIAIKVGNKFISYDESNRVWVIFRAHEKDIHKYHGFDEYDEDNPSKIPIAVKAHFNK